MWLLNQQVADGVWEVRRTELAPEVMVVPFGVSVGTYIMEAPVGLEGQFGDASRDVSER